MDEYPKRLYLEGGQSVVVHTAEEEALWADAIDQNRPAAPVPDPEPPAPATEPTPESGT